MAAGSCVGRPKITFAHGKLLHNNLNCRVVLRKDLVSIGCSDITPEAIRYLLDEYERAFPETAEEVVLQP